MCRLHVRHDAIVIVLLFMVTINDSAVVLRGGTPTFAVGVR